MKKLFILFSIIACSLTAYGQAGSPAYGGVFLRVQDSTTYRAAAAAKHANGYADIYWNEQATTPHFDWWNGSSYEHGFGAGGGGGGGASDWGDLGGTLSDQTDLQAALDAKQATLVSATNIKTVNGNSVLGSGDIDLIDDAIVDGEAKAPSQNAVFDGLATKLTSAMSESTGTTIEFVENRRYNETGSPATGNITINTTGAQLGKVIIVVHEDSSEPTYGTGATLKAGEYTPGEVNYLWYFMMDTGEFHVRITH